LGSLFEPLRLCKGVSRVGENWVCRSRRNLAALPSLLLVSGLSSQHDVAYLRCFPNHYLLSKVLRIVVSAFRRWETERPTAASRTIDPFRPVRPACSEPMAMIR